MEALEIAIAELIHQQHRAAVALEILEARVARLSTHLFSSAPRGR